MSSVPGRTSIHETSFIHVANGAYFAFAAFFRHMLDRNVNLAPSKYEAWFLTTAHTEQDIDDTLEAAEASFREMGKK